MNQYFQAEYSVYVTVVVLCGAFGTSIVYPLLSLKLRVDDCVLGKLFFLLAFSVLYFLSELLWKAFDTKSFYFVLFCYHPGIMGSLSWLEYYTVTGLSGSPW